MPDIPRPLVRSAALRARHTLAALSCAVALAVPAVVHAQAAPASVFTVIPINADPTTGSPGGHAVNNLGQVVGYTVGDLDLEGFITGPQGAGIRLLGGINPVYGSIANGINTTGQVAGRTHDADGYSVAFLTGPNGVGMRSLGTLNPAEPVRESAANDVNEAGQVTGYSRNAAGNREAFLTGPNGVGMQGLGTLNPAGGSSYGWAVNSSGQVAGTSTGAAGRDEAFLTDANGANMRGLGGLGPSVYSEGFAVNAAGQVTGRSLNTNGVLEAFLTGPNGVGMFGLGFGPLGSVGSTGFGVDSHGQVVGDVGDFGFLYTPGAGLRLLDDLVGGGYRITDARGISPDGRFIVAWGFNVSQGIPEHQPQVLLIEITAVSTVPEPGTWALLATGLVGLAAVARRRSRV